MKLEEVQIHAVTPERLLPLIGGERAERFDATARVARDVLSGRTVVNVNTATSGVCVAELLRSLLAYARGAGIDAQWVVIKGDPGFFAITKRVQNKLYGIPGDGGPLGRNERRHYEQVLHADAAELRVLVRPGDVVLLHDPQTAGLAPDLVGMGAKVVWRCHVGVDTVNEHVEQAWDFLHPYLDQVHAFVFTKAAFAPAWADPDRVFVIAPSIDPFAVKNQTMTPGDVEGVLRHVGLLGGKALPSRTTFTRGDGSLGRVDHYTDVLQTGPPPPPDAPLVVQLSRWDRIKDMAGVMTAFASYVDATTSAHLLLAGPVVTSVPDDPEAADAFDECIEVWRQLPHAERTRIHLACLPMADPDEHATIVNAIQRRAAVLTQKSVAQGFGLTVTEAMWKAKPVVATAVGGIVDQVVSGEHGILIGDPYDLAAFGQAVRTLLDQRDYAQQLGTNAHERVLADFLCDRQFEQYMKLFERLQSPAAV
jgi:trehalose synthase